MCCEKLTNHLWWLGCNAVPWMWLKHFRKWPLIMSNVPCKSLPCLCLSSSQRPHCADVKCVRMYVCFQGRAWQQRIWLLSGPWKCNSDLEVLRCLFIARSLGAWPYSQWHFRPLICRRIVMEYLSGVTLCSCHTIFKMAQRSCSPCGGDVTVVWNLAPIQSAIVGGGCLVIDVFHVNKIN